VVDVDIVLGTTAAVACSNWKSSAMVDMTNRAEQQILNGPAKLDAK